MIREAYEAGQAAAFEKLSLYSREEYKHMAATDVGAETAKGGLLGAGMGGALGALLGRIDHAGDLKPSWKGSGKGGLIGAAAGGIPMAALTALIAHEQKKQAKSILGYHE